MDLAEKDYIVVLQCDIVKERCPGYYCEKAFHERTGGFADYPADRTYRTLNLTCGGCCGQATHRKVASLLRKLEKDEGIKRDRVVVQLSTCITKHNHHSPPCPHLGYLLELLSNLKVDVRHDTRISPLAEERRQTGIYPNR
jgi:predicted metal-binding protein